MIFYTQYPGEQGEEEGKEINKNEDYLSSTKIKSNKKYNFSKYIDQQTRFVSQAAWFSRSIDCQNLTGKKQLFLVMQHTQLQ